MGKIYLQKNVYDAAIERYQTALRVFDNCYVSVSGGKDSSILLQLMAQEARKAGKKFSVLYIDLEAQYAATINHIHELIDCTTDVVDHWYWCALPLSLRNAVSALQQSPVVAGVTTIVTATTDPFVGMLAGIVVRALTALLGG